MGSPAAGVVVGARDRRDGGDHGDADAVERVSGDAEVTRDAGFRAVIAERIEYVALASRESLPHSGDALGQLNVLSLVGWAWVVVTQEVREDRAVEAKLRVERGETAR